MPPSTDNPERGSRLKVIWARAKTTIRSPSKSRVESPSTGVPSGSVQPTQQSRSKIDPSNALSDSMSRPIVELWEEAYDQLSKDENRLVNRFEAILSQTLAGAVAINESSSTVAVSGPGKIQRRQYMKILLDKKIEEVESGTWKLRFKNHELQVKDLVGPVVSTIEWAKDFVGTALEASPYASVAWACVCVLLPVRDTSFQYSATIGAEVY
jgi:hypothetical protein